MSMKQDLKIGDTLWQGQTIWTAKPRTCPVCQGSSKVLVKPLGAPDDQGTTVTCQFCYPHHEGQVAGIVTDEWDWEPVATRHRIDGIKRESTRQGDSISYICDDRRVNGSGSYLHIRAEAAHLTEAEALAYAAAHHAHRQEHTKSAAEAVQNSDVNKTHSIGYCKRQVKECTAKIRQLECDLSNARNTLKYAKGVLGMAEEPAPKASRKLRAKKA